jgi:hypothetical protein
MAPSSTTSSSGSASRRSSSPPRRGCGMRPSPICSAACWASASA